jgi:hypothetical protein
MAAQTKSSQRRSSSSSARRSSSTKPVSKRSTGGRASSNASRSRSATATKSRSTGRSSSGRSANRGGRSTASRPSGRAKTPTRTRQARSANGQGTFESVTDAVSSGAQSTAQGIAGAAKKAKTPLIAGGAAVAGLAGAVALNARTRHRKVLGVKMPQGDGVKKAMSKASALKKVDARDVTGTVSEAAKRADRFGKRVSSVANSVQMVSETVDKGAKKPSAASRILRTFS